MGKIPLKAEAKVNRILFAQISKYTNSYLARIIRKNAHALVRRWFAYMETPMTGVGTTGCIEDACCLVLDGRRLKRLVGSCWSTPWDRRRPATWVARQIASGSAKLSSTALNRLARRRRRRDCYNDDILPMPGLSPMWFRVGRAMTRLWVC